MVFIVACNSTPQPQAIDTPTISEPNQGGNQSTTTPSTGIYSLNSYKFTPSSSINFGSGFYTMKEEFLGVGNCLAFGEGFKTLADVLEYEPSAIKVNLSTSIASNRDELLDKLGVSLGLKAAFGGGKITVEGEGKYASEESVNENKLYLVTQANVTGTSFGFLTLGEDRVHIQGYNKDDPSKSTGFAKMYLDEYDSFLERCGDKFVSSITIGGEFYLVIEIDTYSSDHKREIEGKLKVDIEGIGGGNAELTAVMNKLKAQSNIKIKLFSSGLFPDPNTLLNAEKDPTGTVSNLLNSLKSDCLNLQNSTETKARSLGYERLEDDNPLALSSLYDTGNTTGRKFAEDDLKQVLRQLSNCSSRVSLTDYKVLTSQSAAAKALADAKKAIQATYVNSRLMILLSNLGSYVNNLNFYIENPTLYDTATGTQFNEAKAKNHLDTVVSVIEAKMRRQVALCQLRDYASCEQVAVTYNGTTYNETQLSNLINNDWAAKIPNRRNQELPNTCDALQKARGAQTNFSPSAEYTIFYNNDLRRSYRVFCIEYKESNEENWLKLGNSPITANWSVDSSGQTKAPTYLEFLQLVNLNNSASAYTNNQSTDFDLSQGTTSQVSRYDRVHIDPIDLAIVPEVTTYAFNVGHIKPDSNKAKNIFATISPNQGAKGDEISFIPFGSALSCDKTPALSYINLQGTSLYIDPIMSRKSAWTWFGESLSTPQTTKYLAPFILMNPITEGNEKVYGRQLIINTGNLPNQCSLLAPKGLRIKLTLPVDPKQITSDLYQQRTQFSDASYSLPNPTVGHNLRLRQKATSCARSNESNNAVEMVDCKPSEEAQNWFIKPVPSAPDLFVFKNVKNGTKCLDVDNQRHDEGTPILAYECNDTNAQKWRILPQSDGSYQILWAEHSDRCIVANNNNNTVTLQTGKCGSETSYWKISDNDFKVTD